MTKATLVNQPEKYWDRLFAPGGHCGIVTTVDTEGRVNAASFATCVRIVHNPVQIAFTTNPAGHTAQNLLATGSFVVNLPSFERDILEKVRVVGLPFDARRQRTGKGRADRPALDDRQAATHRRMPAPFRMRGGLDQGMDQAPDGGWQCGGCLDLFGLR